jgi:hypothetical protein
VLAERVLAGQRLDDDDERPLVGEHGLEVDVPSTGCSSVMPFAPIGVS